MLEVLQLFLKPETQREMLEKNLQKVDDNITKMMGAGKTKYVERAGTTLLSQLVEKNVWQSLLGRFQRKYCYVCKSTQGKGISCRTEGIYYQIMCKIWLFRAKKEGDVEKEEWNSVLWNHSKEKHSSLMQTDDWKVEIQSSHRSPLQHQITEAVRIAREPKANLLNSKNEFGANYLAEICLKYGNKVPLNPR